MGRFSNRHEVTLDLLVERQADLADQMTSLVQLVGQIHAALVVRDPGNALSAQAYDGLRKTVMAGATQRRSHLVQLVEMADALERGAGPEQLGSMVEEWAMQAGIVRSSDTSQHQLFDVLGGTGDMLRVLSPAWVDSQNGALIKRGTAERIPSPPVQRPVPPASRPGAQTEDAPQGAESQSQPPEQPASSVEGHPSPAEPQSSPSSGRQTSSRSADPGSGSDQSDAVEHVTAGEESDLLADLMDLDDKGQDPPAPADAPVSEAGRGDAPRSDEVDEEPVSPGEPDGDKQQPSSKQEEQA